MKYAKVRQYIPKYKRVREVDPETDVLLSDVFKDDRLIVDRKTELTRDLLDDFERRDLRRIWVKTDTYDWMLYDRALTRNLKIVEEKKAEPLQDHLLSNLNDVHSVQTLLELIEQYEQESVDEMLFSELVTLRSHLKEILNRQEELSEKIEDVDDLEIKLQVVDVLRSRNPDVDPSNFPSAYRSLVKELMDFLDDLRTAREEFERLILEIEPENTPQVAMETFEDSGLISNGDREALKTVKDPLVEASDFADELYACPGGDLPPVVNQQLVEPAHELMESVLWDARWDPDKVQKLLANLRHFHEILPSIYWLVPLDATRQSNLLMQGLTGLVIHGHVWPEDFLTVEDFEPGNRWIFSHLIKDLGMTKVPEKFWLHDGSLSDSQHNHVEKHVGYTVDLLDEIDGAPDGVEPWVRQHHRKGESAGYPQELYDSSWPEEARKLAYCDVFESLTSERLWREPFSPRRAYEIMREDFQDESDFLDEFITSLSDYPPSSLIRLSNDDVALIETVIPDEDEVYYKIVERDDECVNDINETITHSETEQEIKSSPSRRASTWPIRRLRWQYDPEIDLG